MAKHYRYILSGLVDPDSGINNYRLISSNIFSKFCSSCIRVEIPKNITLEKYSCNNYSTTHDKTPIKKLNPTVIIKYNGKWKKNDYLTQQWIEGYLQPHEFFKNIKGYDIINDKVGFVTIKQSKWYNDNKKYAWKLEKLPECNGDEKDFKIPEINRERKKDIDTIRKFLINNGISMDNILDEELEWRWHIGLIDEITGWVSPTEKSLPIFLNFYKLIFSSQH